MSEQTPKNSKIKHPESWQDRRKHPICSYSGVQLISSVNRTPRNFRMDNASQKKSVLNSNLQLKSLSVKLIDHHISKTIYPF